MKNPISPRRSALIQNHMDLARFGATKDTPFFWVLDLEDPRAFQMAVAWDPGKSEKKVAEHRDAILSTRCYPAFTAITSMECANALITTGWNLLPYLETDPDGKLLRYMGIVSEGRIIIILL